MIMPVLNDEEGFFTMRVAFVEKIRRALTDEGVEICALDRIV